MSKLEKIEYKRANQSAIGVPSEMKERGHSKLG